MLNLILEILLNDYSVKGMIKVVSVMPICKFRSYGLLLIRKAKLSLQTKYEVVKDTCICEVQTTAVEFRDQRKITLTWYMHR